MDDERQRVLDALLPGERLLWSGRPDPRVIFAPADLYLIPFSALWLAFTIFWTVAATAGHAPGFFTLFGLAFVAYGLYFAIGRFVYKALQKRRTTYALTDRRAIVLRGRSTLDSPIAGRQVSVVRGRDGGHVSVTFGDPVASRWASNSARYANTGMDLLTMGSQAVAFYDVADVAALESALKSARTPVQ